MNPQEAIYQTRGVIRRQHKALATEESYLNWLRRYMLALRQMPDSMPSEKKLERFLSEPAQARDVSASTQNQAFNAISFFYKDVLGQPLKNVDAWRARRPAQLRQAPTVTETRALLAAILPLITARPFMAGVTVRTRPQSRRDERKVRAPADFFRP